MKLISVFSICFVFTAAGGMAQAQGVLFESRQTQNGQATTNQVQMDKTHVRTETQVSGQSTVTGFPVCHISYQNGKPTSTTEVTDVKHMTFPASTFEVPAGFRKEAFAGGRR
jgi:hypothetical protein